VMRHSVDVGHCWLCCPL